MQGTLGSLVGALALVLAADAAPPLAPRERPVRVLDLREADVLEDEPGSRVVAAVSARLERDGGGRTWLRLLASPEGPRVDPPPGAHGVHGSNRITADEIRALLAGGRLALAVEGPRGSGTGRLWAGRPCRVLERRFEQGGRVVHEALAGPDAPHALAGEVALDGEGLHEVTLTADGKVRLAARCRVGHGTARFLALESVSAHQASRP